MSKETAVIKAINKDGTVDIELSNRVERGEARHLSGNWHWVHVVVKGLNLKSCDIGDVLMVDVGSNSREREVTFIQNLTKDAKPYVNDLVGNLNYVSNDWCFVAAVGGKRFCGVKLGNFGDSRRGDLVKVRVSYDKDGNIMYVEVVDNISAKLSKLPNPVNCR